MELLIKNLVDDDSGLYTCVCGEQTTTATLTVNGKITSSYYTPVLGRSLVLWMVTGSLHWVGGGQSLVHGGSTLFMNSSSPSCVEVSYL